MKRFFSKSIATLLAVVMVIGLFSTGVGVLTANAAGYSSDGYYIITTAAELDNVRNNLSGKYRLGADIDLTWYSSSYCSASNGWTGIGATQAKAFKGELDGNGYTIKGLWSSKKGSNQGLFGWLSGAIVKNLTIELASRGITGCGERVGALAGNAYDGTYIERVHVVGAGSGSTVSGSANYIAGLVGVVYKSAINTATVTNVGVGGCSYVGGIAGVTYGSSIVYNADVTNVQIEAKGSYAGGSIGAIYGGSTITYGDVTNALVSSSCSYAGGFVGAVYEKGSSVSNSCVDNVSVNVKTSYVGGFAGVVYHYATVTKSVVTYAEAFAQCGRSAGGFVGEIYDYATASRCYAIGVDARAQYYVGGWTGAVYGHSSVEISCAYGYATTTAGYVAGGFAGYVAYTTINNCYAQVDVTTKITGGTGGFAGYFEVGSKVYNSYCAGKVTNLKGDSAVYNGAFSGYSYVNFLGTNYYDSQITGYLRPYGSGGIKSGAFTSYPQGYNTAMMKTKSTFVGWDFNTIWRIDEGVTYPYFWNMGCGQTSDPTINTITEGDRTVTGRGIPGGYIEVKYPDGSVSYAVVSSAGTWVTIVPTAVNLIEGDIVSAVQQYGNKLPSNRVYTTVIGLPISAPPVFNEVKEGDNVVTGTGIADSAITVTLPNGATVSATVDSAGEWMINVPTGVMLLEGETITAVQQEVGKKVSPPASTVVVDYPEVDPGLDVEVENLTTGESFAVAGDTLMYDAIISNNGVPASIWESAYVTFGLNGVATLQTSTIRINYRSVDPSQYSYDSATNSLTVYLGDIAGGSSVAVSFRVTISTDLPDIEETILNTDLGSLVTRSIIYRW